MKVASSKTTIVQWSPHDSNKFVVGRDDLRLYQVISEKSTDAAERATVQINAGLFVPKRRSFRGVDVVVPGDVPQLRCLDWFPGADNPLLVGAGLGSGNLVLTKFNAWNGDETEGIGSAVQTEFKPKSRRPSNAVAWNPMNNSQIAVGLEKVRGEYSTLIWDVQHGSQKSAEVETHRRPGRQLANAESIVALSWLPGQQQCLAIGTGLKWLRMYDLRTSNAQPRSVIAHSKAVHGVKFDKLRPHMLATFSEGTNEPIKIWDIRRLGAEAKPAVILLPSLNKVTHLAWLPTRAGILATSGPKQPWIALWDINKGLIAKKATAATNAVIAAGGGGSGGGSSGGGSGSSSSGASTPTRGEAADHEPEIISKPFRRRYTTSLFHLPSTSLFQLPHLFHPPLHLPPPSPPLHLFSLPLPLPLFSPLLLRFTGTRGVS
jgi:hypothetical protein